MGGAEGNNLIHTTILVVDCIVSLCLNIVSKCLCALIIPFVVCLEEWFFCLKSIAVVEKHRIFGIDKQCHFFVAIQCELVARREIEASTQRTHVSGRTNLFGIKLGKLIWSIMVHHHRLTIFIHHLRSILRVVLPITEPLLKCLRAHLCPLLLVKVCRLTIGRLHVCSIRLGSINDILLFSRETKANTFVKVPVNISQHLIGCSAFIVLLVCLAIAIRIVNLYYHITILLADILLQLLALLQGGLLGHLYDAGFGYNSYCTIIHKVHNIFPSRVMFHIGIHAFNTSMVSTTST